MPTRSPKRSCRGGGSSADASATTHPERTPAWLQSPEHLRRPGDFRSYCHAPARLWPPEPSTDSLDLTHNWPARGARLFQTGALPAHRCPVKPGITGKRSRPTACCLPLARHSGPWRSLHFSLAPANSQSAVQVLSLPASQGRCNKRPGYVFPSHHRCAKNPRHNITQHCITPRGKGGASPERHQVADR